MHFVLSNTFLKFPLKIEPSKNLCFTDTMQKSISAITWPSTIFKKMDNRKWIYLQEKYLGLNLMFLDNQFKLLYGWNILCEGICSWSISISMSRTGAEREKAQWKPKALRSSALLFVITHSPMDAKKASSVHKDYFQQ